METKYLCKLLAGGYLIDSVGTCVGKRRHANRFDTIEDLFAAADHYSKRRQMVVFSEVSFVVIRIHTFPMPDNSNNQ